MAVVKNTRAYSASGLTSDEVATYQAGATDEDRQAVATIAYQTAQVAYALASASYVQSLIDTGEHEQARRAASVVANALGCSCYWYRDSKNPGDLTTRLDTGNLPAIMSKVQALHVAATECPMVASDVATLVRSYVRDIGDSFYNCANYKAPEPALVVDDTTESN